MASSPTARCGSSAAMTPRRTRRSSRSPGCGPIGPSGPALQYTAERHADPITLYVYTGADGAFTLYEDDGLTFAYEKGACSRIPLQWDEETKTLRIGKRAGSFPAMPGER